MSLDNTKHSVEHWSDRCHDRASLCSKIQHYHFLALAAADGQAKCFAVTLDGVVLLIATIMAQAASQFFGEVFGVDELEQILERTQQHSKNPLLPEEIILRGNSGFLLIYLLFLRFNRLRTSFW